MRRIIYDIRMLFIVLMIVSILTGLFTEGIKKLLEESKKSTRQFPWQEEWL